jgi:hypothetical protein
MPADLGAVMIRTDPGEASQTGSGTRVNESIPMNDEQRRDAETSDPPDAISPVRLLADAGRAAPERRRRLTAYRPFDVSDILEAAVSRGIEIRVGRCAAAKPAPSAVVTAGRRVLDTAIQLLGPPVSSRLDVHICDTVGQLALQVTARDRHSFARLQAQEQSPEAWIELSAWLSAFSPLFSVAPVRRGRANIAAILAFDFATSWASPKCGRLHIAAG